MTVSCHVDVMLIMNLNINFFVTGVLCSKNSDAL